MKCPFCGDEMRSGYLQSTHRFFWSAERIGILHIMGKDDVKVNKSDWVGAYTEADYCPRCKKIITSVPEKE